MAHSERTRGFISTQSLPICDTRVYQTGNIGDNPIEKRNLDLFSSYFASDSTSFSPKLRIPVLCSMKHPIPGTFEETSSPQVIMIIIISSFFPWRQSQGKSLAKQSSQEEQARPLLHIVYTSTLSLLAVNPFWINGSYR